MLLLFRDVSLPPKEMKKKSQQSVEIFHWVVLKRESSPAINPPWCVGVLVPSHQAPPCCFIFIVFSECESFVHQCLTVGRHVNGLLQLRQCLHSQPSTVWLVGFTLASAASYNMQCVSLPMPTVHFDCVIIYIMSLLPRAWFILSFASPEQPPLAHFLDELGFSSSALWLTNDFVKSDMVSCRKKSNINWILASVGSLICHLFNIDVHYVYGLFGCLLFSGPARPVRSATWGSGPLIMSFWLMAFIV